MHSQQHPQQLPYRSSIRNLPIRRIVVLSKASKVVIRKLNLLLLYLQESFHLAPPVISITTLLMTPPQWNSPLVEDEMNVGRWWSIKIYLLSHSIRINGRRCFDNFDIETASKRLEMRKNKLSGRLNVSCVEYVVELCDAECDKAADDTGVVAKVQIEVLIYGESDSVVVESDVDLGGRGGDDVVLHAGEDFFHVACTKSVW